MEESWLESYFILLPIFSLLLIEFPQLTLLLFYFS